MSGYVVGDVVAWCATLAAFLAALAALWCVWQAKRTTGLGRPEDGRQAWLAIATTLLSILLLLLATMLAMATARRT